MEALESPTAIAMPATVQTPPQGAMGVQLFVSTSLAQWETTEPHRIARDSQIDDTVYRRLDPESEFAPSASWISVLRCFTTGSAHRNVCSNTARG